MGKVEQGEVFQAEASIQDGLRYGTTDVQFGKVEINLFTKVGNELFKTGFFARLQCLEQLCKLRGVSGFDHAMRIAKHVQLVLESHVYSLHVLLFQVRLLLLVYAPVLIRCNSSQVWVR